MKPYEIELIKKAAVLFGHHKQQIIKNWIEAVKREKTVSDDSELDYFISGFEQIVSDFAKYLSVADFNGYYQCNAEVAARIAYNDISYQKFVEVFHLFEDSYGHIITENIDKNDILKCIGAIDRVHHKTISTVSNAYFSINDVTVFALAKLAELRDPETGFHLERTREYSMALSKQLGLSETFIANIYRVGPLHDIGKVGIRDNILLKPASLTDAEYAIMKTHVTIGAGVITSIIGGHNISRGYLLMARDIVLYHHEKFDGTGYPVGLAGERIPLAARIFTLADAYDAIVSKRPYKEALPHEEAVARIKKDCGSHFDPKVVAAFLEIHEQFRAVNEKYKEESLKALLKN